MAHSYQHLLLKAFPSAGLTSSSLLPRQYSLCNESLIELTNPGASGSIFYVTRDDEFIIKTVQHKEAEFLQKLLPGYYMVSQTGDFTRQLNPFPRFECERK